MLIQWKSFRPVIDTKLFSESGWNYQQYRFATKKAGGSVKNGRDSIGQHEYYIIDTLIII